jgi:cytoskeletal protein RodZ
VSVSPAPPSRRRLLLILLTAVVVVLVGVAVAVSALAPRTDQQAATAPPSATSPPSTAAASTDAPSSASPASASPTEEAAKPAAAELLDEANTVCEMRVTEKYPTAEVQPGTKSTAKAKNGSFETTGSYTDPTAGKSAPTQFQCASVNTSGTWTVNLERG